MQKLTGNETFRLNVPVCHEKLVTVRDLVLQGVLSIDGQPQFVLEGDQVVQKHTVHDFIAMFNEVCYRKFRGTDKNARQFNARTKDGFTLEDMHRATIAAKRDDFHREKKFKYLTPEYMLRADILQRYLNAEVEPEKKSMFDD